MKPAGTGKARDFGPLSAPSLAVSLPSSLRSSGLCLTVQIAVSRRGCAVLAAGPRREPWFGVPVLSLFGIDPIRRRTGSLSLQLLPVRACY